MSLINEQQPLQTAEHLAEIGLVAHTLGQMNQTPVRPGHILPVPPINTSPEGIANGIGVWIIAAFLFKIMLILVAILLGVTAAPFILVMALTQHTGAFVPVCIASGVIWGYFVAWKIIRGACRFWFKRL